MIYTSSFKQWKQINFQIWIPYNMRVITYYIDQAVWCKISWVCKNAPGIELGEFNLAFPLSIFLC